jgi:hypothetical protein
LFKQSCNQAAEDAKKEEEEEEEEEEDDDDDDDEEAEDAKKKKMKKMKQMKKMKKHPKMQRRTLRRINGVIKTFLFPPTPPLLSERGEEGFRSSAMEGGGGNTYTTQVEIGTHGERERERSCRRGERRRE